MADDEEEKNSEDGGPYRAAATNVQVTALGRHLRGDVCGSQVLAHVASSPFRRAANADLAVARQWLSNAWSTERLLRLQTEMDPEVQRFAVQWAFPQAYYACYCQVLGLFAVAGYSENKHTSTIRRFGLLARDRMLPPCLAIHADGGLNEIVPAGVQKGSYRSTVHLALDDPASVENQIAQLLTSTREIALKEKKKDFKFETVDGKRKKSLNRTEWASISERLGPTTILAYLYRKRIKANYRDIDSWLRSEIDGPAILNGLVDVVNGFALLCEGHVHVLANPRERAHIASHPLYPEQFLQDRQVLLRGSPPASGES